MKRCPRLTDAQKRELATHMTETDDLKEVKRASLFSLWIATPPIRPSRPSPAIKNVTPLCSVNAT